MLRRRILKSIITLIMVVGTAGALSLLGPWGCSYPIGVPLFLRSGGVRCFGGNDLVEISCYYQGSPNAYGDDYQDHVFLENAGGAADVGHIPDFFVNLGGVNPPVVHIPLCA
jgi:hypothetical protein